MGTFGIILLIIGAVTLLISGATFISSTIALKNEENWNAFSNYWNEHGNSAISDETLYQLVIKIRLVSGSISLVALLILVAGIMLTVIK